MFELREVSTFVWPAVAKVPQAGKYIKVEFEATFKVLSQPEIAALIGDDADGGSLRVLREALVSFKGISVVDADGDAVEDDDERNEMLLSKPYFVNALSEAWASGISGRKVKN